MPTKTVHIFHTDNRLAAPAAEQYRKNAAERFGVPIEHVLILDGGVKYAGPVEIEAPQLLFEATKPAEPEGPQDYTLSSGMVVKIGDRVYGVWAKRRGTIIGHLDGAATVRPVDGGGNWLSQSGLDIKHERDYVGDDKTGKPLFIGDKVKPGASSHIDTVLEKSEMGTVKLQCSVSGCSTMYEDAHNLTKVS